MMKTMDRIAGWLLVALGLVHLSLTGRIHPNLGLNAIWFASGGLFMMTIGALNLLRVAYGPVARGVRAVSVVANLVLLLLMVAMALRVPMRGNPQLVFALVLVALLTAFSLFRRLPQLQTQQAKIGK